MSYSVCYNDITQEQEKIDGEEIRRHIPIIKSKLEKIEDQIVMKLNPRLVETLSCDINWLYINKLGKPYFCSESYDNIDIQEILNNKFLEVKQ